MLLKRSHSFTANQLITFCEVDFVIIYMKMLFINIYKTLQEISKFFFDFPITIWSLFANKSGEINGTNPCSVCDPSVDTTAWSTNTSWFFLIDFIYSI